MNPKWKKEMEELNARGRLLEALLVTAGTRLPTIKDFILSEVVNGAIAAVGGEAGKVTYKDCRLVSEGFEHDLWDYFTEEMQLHAEHKITPAVRTALEKMCEPHSVHCPPDRPYPTTELYTFFRGTPLGGGICHVRGQSIFSFPYDVVMRVRESIIPALPEARRKDVLAIGTAMQPFVADDLAFIRQTYHW